MDGVIIDGMPFHIEAWQRAFARYNISISPMDVFLLEGIKTSEVADILCLDKGIALSTSEKLEIVDLKRRIYKEVFRVVPLSGSTDFVQALASYGYSLALVTGTLREAAERALGELQIRDYFSCIISSESAHEGKPSPEPYRQALVGLNTDPEDCLAVENSPPGITSAKSAGISCIAIATYLEPIHLSQADKVLGDVREAANWFKAEFARSKGQGSWCIQ